MARKWWFGAGTAVGAALGGYAAARTLEASRRQQRLQRLLARPVPGERQAVILGGGFAGVHCAIRLLQLLPAESGWRVHLVDRHNYFVFTPLLYHAATGLVDPSNVLYPLRAISQAPHYRFREATVLDVDFAARQVLLDDGVLQYDRLVLALGSTTNFFGAEQSLAGALTLKTAGDAIRVRNHVIDAFERADISTDTEERRRLLTFVVVGGGATGVELAGALQGLVRGTLARQYPRIARGEARVILLEAHDQLLRTLPPALARHAAQRLKEQGVQLRLGCAARRVSHDGLETQGGEWFPSHTVIWAAGVRPAPVADAWQLPRGPGARLEVDNALRVPGQPGVYALGDLAACPDPFTAGIYPPNAATAVRQGTAAAEILCAELLGEEPSPFAYRQEGELVSLGRHEAVAELLGTRLTGLPAWILWRALYLSKLMGFKNRLAVALDWTFAYAYERETVRLEIPSERRQSTPSP